MRCRQSVSRTGSAQPNMTTPTTPEAQEAIDLQCERIEKLYPAEELPPWSAYQYGEVCGKLSALRWVTGYEWDMLDTGGF